MRWRVLIACGAAMIMLVAQTTDRAPAQQPEPPAAGAVPAPPMPTPARMVLVGDSLATSIGAALVRSADAQGLFLYNGSRSGCSQIDGITTTPSGGLSPWSTGCADGNAEFQRNLINDYQPQLIIWFSSWESVDRILGDTWVHFATFGGNPRIIGEIDAAVARLTAGGARLVIVIPAPVPEGSTSNHDAIPRLGHLSTVLREYARLHADRVYVAELSELLCPAGPPCPATVNGAVPRPDGMHFDDPASQGWVADWMIAKALAPVTPAAPQPGRINAGVV